ncbi:prolyl-tRNA editing enzyme YbaK/EbsC (Cys-tRNA(Pro) deacylase) [Saccharothrix tamanrassetensis]|uniref:Prolyl-tRNA editing enzyme YbaK/EbsC (Cys-tRNA(Pro) deacylase) n=1 Tax=Saccharothrix tamanrassetensis TaxID=1051531 RepID=A0A841CRQ2_9PSEU|nr:YbaK/EbsC family protein [Saccharothrix tamanrassetensis]MBB5959920.1 prolyl-tRNA editing enzyme YbaK/EbsC (Cys-tRNA(Pro) deacylase) [Saccharothrix tamanrassetensis]
MSALDHPGIRKVAAGLSEAGHHEAANGIRVLADAVRTAAEAAQAVGVPVGAIANSLVFSAVRDGAAGPLLVLTSGAHRADTDLLAGLAGADRIERAKPDFVREHTGQVIGGVSPIGHPAPIRTFVDVDLEQYEVVWAAAGHPHAVFPTTYAGLVELTGGTPARVAR